MTGKRKYPCQKEQCIDNAIGNQSWYSRARGWESLARGLKAELIYNASEYAKNRYWSNLPENARFFWYGQAAEALNADVNRINEAAEKHVNEHFSEEE